MLIRIEWFSLGQHFMLASYTDSYSFCHCMYFLMNLAEGFVCLRAWSTSDVVSVSNFMARVLPKIIYSTVRSQT